MLTEARTMAQKFLEELHAIRALLAEIRDELKARAS